MNSTIDVTSPGESGEFPRRDFRCFVGPRRVAFQSKCHHFRGFLMWLGDVFSFAFWLVGLFYRVFRGFRCFEFRRYI